MALFFSILGGLAVLSGGALIVWQYEWCIRRRDTLIAFAAGSLISLALVEIVPEALEESRHAAYFALGGFVLLFLFDQFLHPHPYVEESPLEKPVSLAAWFGLLLHSLIDGVVIGAGFRASSALGALITFGIVLHKFVDGFASSSILLGLKFDRARLMAYSGFMALATPIGTVVSFFVPFGRPGTGDLLPGVLGLTAGMFIYISAGDFLPHFHGSRTRGPMLSFLLGCLFFVLLKVLIPAS